MLLDPAAAAQLGERIHRRRCRRDQDRRRAPRGRRASARSRLCPPTGGQAALVEQLVAIVRSAARTTSRRSGSACRRSSSSRPGKILSSVNIPLTDVPLRELLTERIGVPVYVENDAAVAALAEAHDERSEPVRARPGDAHDRHGRRRRLVLSGRLYRGATGAAGELGHTIVGLRSRRRGADADGRRSRSRVRWSSLASGRALDRLAEQAARVHPDSELGRLHADGKPVLGADAVQAAHDGDLPARRSSRSGAAARDRHRQRDQHVRPGGGRDRRRRAAQAGELLLDPAKRVASGYVLPGLGERTTIRLARHGVRAGVLGATLLALHELDVPAPTPTEVGS